MQRIQLQVTGRLTLRPHHRRRRSRPRNLRGTTPRHHHNHNHPKKRHPRHPRSSRPMVQSSTVHPDTVALRPSAATSTLTGSNGRGPTTRTAPSSLRSRDHSSRLLFILRIAAGVHVACNDSETDPAPGHRPAHPPTTPPTASEQAQEPPGHHTPPGSPRTRGPLRPLPTVSLRAYRFSRVSVRHVSGTRIDIEVLLGLLVVRLDRALLGRELLRCDLEHDPR